MRRLRLLVVVADGDSNRTFSYQHGWPRQIAGDARYKTDLLNLKSGRWISSGRSLVLRLQRYDAIVLMHSVFSNVCELGGWLLDAIRAHGAPKVYFIGNEYKLMPEKMAFCEDVGVRLLITQSHSPRVHGLYKGRLKCAVAGLPNTGWDPERFFSERPRTERPIDIGYRSVASPLYLGHNEREEILEAFREAARVHGLTVDLSLDPSHRLDETAWARFLNDCKGQLGTEAGGDYFELDDASRLKVNAFLELNPKATLTEVRQRFFDNQRDHVPMRIISSRNVEAAATRTVQLLLEGEYGGYFEAGVHYIAVCKDYANLDEALRQFKDEAICEEITQRAYAVARDRLAFPVLLSNFDAALRSVI